ncbi:MAG TPA: hypothetical protein VK892_05315, partial [Pyrinomonadaceae bacterium]|nr:hypothetical protein [Pyrinomonadaceae bacterium]
WSEKDEIEIALPAGFELDSTENPGDVTDTGKVGALTLKIKVDKERNLLVYNRDFYFGGDGKILFSASAYQSLKNLFDLFHKADTHTITLKQK